jgi:hypothetical protein
MGSAQGAPFGNVLICRELCQVGEHVYVFGWTRPWLGRHCGNDISHPTNVAQGGESFSPIYSYRYCFLQRPIRSLEIWVAPSSTFAIECGASATQVCSFLLVILLYQSRPIGIAELVSVPPKTTFT